MDYKETISFKTTKSVKYNLLELCKEMNTTLSKVCDEAVRRGAQQMVEELLQPSSSLSARSNANLIKYQMEVEEEFALTQSYLERTSDYCLKGLKDMMFTGTSETRKNKIFAHLKLLLWSGNEEHFLNYIGAVNNVPAWGKHLFDIVWEDFKKDISLEQYKYNAIKNKGWKYSTLGLALRCFDKKDASKKAIEMVRKDARKLEMDSIKKEV